MQPPCGAETFSPQVHFRPVFIGESPGKQIPQILTSRSPRGAHPQAAALPSGAASRTDGVLASLRNAATLVVRSQPNTDSALLRELLPRRLTNASSISFPIVGQLAQPPPPARGASLRAPGTAGCGSAAGR